MITEFLSLNLVEALSWTLIHSLWQISLISVVLFIVLSLGKNLKAPVRHSISFVALGLVVLSALVTFCSQFQTVGQTEIELTAFGGEFLTGVETAETNVVQQLLAWAETQGNVLVSVWALGVLFFLVKFILGFTFLKRLVKSAEFSDLQQSKKFKKLIKKFGIQRRVLIKNSASIASPMVIGFMRPVILFPLCMINQLTPEELTAILAHELAHIKRHDFLLNMIQSLTEAMFYYHPALWYISHSINREREACCDDMAINYTGDNVSYAKTLIRLQEFKQEQLQPALAFGGRSGDFSLRIKRLLEMPSVRTGMKERLFAVTLVLASLLGMNDGPADTISNDLDDLDVYIIDDCPQNIDDIQFYLDTIPERNNFHIKKRDKDREIEMHVVEGVLEELKINGDLIPKDQYDQVASLIDNLRPNFDKDMITVFPDCGDDFSNIYLLNKNRSVFPLDTILIGFADKMKKFENLSESKLGFHISKFDDKLMDSLRQEIATTDWDEVLSERKVRIDSLLELLPFHDSEGFSGLSSDDFNKISPRAFFDSIPDSRSWYESRADKISHRAYKRLCDFEVNAPNEACTNVADRLANELLRDGIISDKYESTIEISSKHLKIDGDKQPKNLWNKYKKIYENSTGISLGKGSVVKLTINPADYLCAELF